MIDVDHLDQVEQAHAAHLQAENIGAIGDFASNRRCPYCGSGFVDMELYRRHLRRANRTGLCLGDGPPRG